ncbi:MAG: DUF2141 domain-containing protein [Pseudomonadota bacterium]
MQRMFVCVMVFLLTTGCGAGVSAAAERGANHPMDHLEIRMRGVRSTEGNVVLAVYDEEEAFELQAEPLAWIAVPAQTQSVTLAKFPRKPIAIAAFHDSNSNGVYDMRDDIPLEGWGNSGAIAAWSQPTFQAADTEASLVIVQTHYFR